MVHNGTASGRILPLYISNEAVSEGLYNVVAQSEAQAMFGKSQKTIDVARWRGRLIYRKSGKVWLITLASLIALYGMPIYSMACHAEDSATIRLGD